MYPLITFADGVSVPTYFIWLSLTCCLCLVWVVKRAKSWGLRKNEALDLALMVMIGGFIGGRLGHVIFESPMYYLSNPIKVFYFWEGGYVFYGGLIGGFLSAYRLVEYRRQNPYLWMDFATPVLSGGYALGRVACFFAGCCYGKICEWPWGLKIWVLHDGVPRHPTQLYSTFCEFLILATLFLIEKLRVKQNHNPSFVHYILNEQGALFYIWLMMHGFFRLILEQFRDDFRGQIWIGLSISTWLSMIVIGLGISGLISISRRLVKSV